MDKDSKTSDGTTPPSIAHNIKSKPRTKDISPCENVDFAGLLLSQHVLDGLKNAGFERPSPIQLKAIPLGRCGLDLVVQAKSGTGKTCVFSVIALGNLNLNSVKTQVLVLAPTREIAVQIWEVINSLGCFIPGLKCHTFIGGLPIAEDKTRLQKCHIAVGTPGRVKQLIEERIFNTESIRLFILDEADKLLEDSFQETINWIYSSLSENKQMLALSATYPEAMAKHLTRYMRNPTYIRLNSEDPALLGIRQYMKAVPFHHLPQSIFKEKCKALMELLSFISFNQCLVFSNYQMRAQSLSDLLASKGWPSTYISGSQDQVSRLTAMAKLKTFQCRILISTDLTSRGIDAENVNLIVNLDLPRDHETYLHRIGRAGRFGSYGAAITLVTHGKELADLRSLEKQCNTRIKTLPEPIPSDLARSSGYVNIDDLVITETVANGARNAQTEGDTFIKSRGQDDIANQLTDTVGDTRDNYHQFNRNALELIRKETGPPDRGIPRETQSSESNAISLGTDHSLFKGTCMRYHNDCHVSFTSLMGSQLNFSSIDAVVKDKVEISKPKEIISLSKNYFSEAIVQVSQLLNELSLKRAELEEAKDIKKTVGREGFQVSPKEQFSSIASAERVEEQTLDIDNSLFDPVSVSIEDSRLEDRQLGLKYLERIHATSDNDSDDFTTISDLESDLDDNDHLYETGEDEHHSREQQPECNKYPYNAFETVDSDYMYAKDDLAEMQYHDYNTHDDYYHHNQDHSALGFNQFNSTYNAEQPEMVDAARENHAWRDCFHESIQYLEWLNRAHLSNYAQYCYHINHLHCQYASMYEDMYICASEKLNQLET